jgi:hypothetical protein
MHRHHHTCPACGRTWECYIPGDCRTDRERECPHCSDDDDDAEEDEE